MPRNFDSSGSLQRDIENAIDACAERIEKRGNGKYPKGYSNKQAKIMALDICEEIMEN